MSCYGCIHYVEIIDLSPDGCVTRKICKKQKQMISQARLIAGCPEYCKERLSNGKYRKMKKGDVDD